MANDRNRTDEQYAGPGDGRRDIDEDPMRGGADEDVRGIADESDDEFDDTDDLDDDDEEEETEGSF